MIKFTFDGVKDKVRGLLYLHPSTRRFLFRRYFHTNYWGHPDSVSGIGSSLEQTAIIRVELPKLFAQFGIRTLVDAPCGDLRWMSLVDHGLDAYTGCDIVPELVAMHRAQALPGQSFEQVDIISAVLPQADAILSRDSLVHFSFAYIAKAIEKFKASGSTYLITTTFTGRTENRDIPPDQWRPLNFTVAPFFFPPPLAVINEGCTEGVDLFTDKSLAIWRIMDLPSL